MIGAIVRIGLIAAALCLGACASPARPDRIAAPIAAGESFDSSHPLHGAVNVDQVQGGSETNPLWMSNISNAQFNEGLAQSLRNAGLMAHDPAQARYRVVANLQDLRRPLAGFDMDVSMSVRYTLTPIAGGAPIFDEVVASTGVGRMSDAFVGVERLRIANEAAARANIAEFIRRLRTQAPAQSLAPLS